MDKEPRIAISREQQLRVQELVDIENFNTDSWRYLPETDPIFSVELVDIVI